MLSIDHRGKFFLILIQFEFDYLTCLDLLKAPFLTQTCKFVLFFLKITPHIMGSSDSTKLKCIPDLLLRLLWWLRH